MGFFGALLGGGMIRAGERFHEEADRQHELEKWQRSKELEMLADHMAKNWDNMTADQQMSTLDMVAPKFGKKGKDLYPMVTAMKAVHTMIPQIQAVPEALGPVQRSGTVTAAPSTEAPVRGISAPATPQFSDLPTPGATLSPSIMAPSTGGTASFGRDMTPNQMKAQQAADQAAALRKQRISEIQVSDLPPRYKEMAEANAYGLNVIPYESAGVRAEAQKYKVDKDQLAKGKLEFYVVPGATPGSSHVVNYRNLGGKLFDEKTGEQVMLPPEAEPIQQKVTPMVNDAGDLNLVNQQRAIGPGNYRATIPNAGRRTQPRVAGGVNAQIPEEDVVSVAEQVYQGKIAPSQVVGGLGVNSLRAQVQRYLTKKHPDFNWKAAEGGYGADKASLAALSKNRDAVVAFENTSLKNLEVFQNAAKGLLDSGSPIINTPLRMINRAVLGSTDLAAYDAARRVAINEIAKVTSNPNLTGQLSDAARREVENFVPENATIAQINAVANILKQDMANRHRSLDEQLSGIKGRMGGGQAGASDADYGPVEDAVVDGKPTKVRKNLKTGKYRRID